MVAPTSNTDVAPQDLLAGTYRSITEGVTVTCATDGNHGRSVAWGAQRFGCNCVIYIHAGVSEGRKHIVRRMLQAVGHPVLKLRRIRFDGVRLGALATGRWRHLTPAEIARLRRARSTPSRKPGRSA